MTEVQIFSSIRSHLEDIHKGEEAARKRAYRFQSNLPTNPEVEKPEQKVTAKMEKIRRKIKAIEDRDTRYIAFKRQLKEGVGLLTPDVYKIEELKKPWRVLDNDQRNNRLMDYLNRKYEGKEREELMTLLIPEIPNRLLQKFAVDWDQDNATIINLPCVQIRKDVKGKNSFYFAG